MTTVDWPVESTAFIGPIGRLVPVPITQGSSITVDEDAGWVFRRTVTGKVHGQRLKSLRRTWKVDLESYPSRELYKLQMITSGAYGPGPFVWVTPQAQATNLIDRDSSLLEGVNNDIESYSLLGVTRMPDGTECVARRAAVDVGATQVRLSKQIPLSPKGGPITTTAWLLSGYLFYIWVTDTGVETSAEYGTWPSTYDGRWFKHTLTQTPPPSAVACIVVCAGARGYAGAQTVWGDTPAPSYTLGHGVWKAAITELPEAYGPQIDVDGVWSQVSFDVQEIG